MEGLSVLETIVAFAVPRGTKKKENTFIDPACRAALSDKNAITLPSSSVLYVPTRPYTSNPVTVHSVCFILPPSPRPPQGIVPGRWSGDAYQPILPRPVSDIALPAAAATSGATSHPRALRATIDEAERVRSKKSGVALPPRDTAEPQSVSLFEPGRPEPPLPFISRRAGRTDALSFTLSTTDGALVSGWPRTRDLPLGPLGDPRSSLHQPIVHLA